MQVDDQLQLVKALEIGDFGLVAGVDQRLETGGDQLGRAAAQDRLLAEQVGLGLLAEARLDRAGARAADPGGIGERLVARLPGRILMDREQARHAAADLIFAADQVAGPLGRDQHDVEIGAVAIDLAVDER